MRILIVDDEYVSRTKMKVLLSDHGDCDAAPNGELALDLVEDALRESCPYDLITMDVDMPGMTGEKVVRAIRDREWNWAKETGKPVHEAQILMATVRKDTQTVIDSFRGGCEGYLVKPVTPESLNQALVGAGLVPAV
jgi:two-component system chemotaxis response regulator CheY